MSAYSALFFSFLFPARHALPRAPERLCYSTLTLLKTMYNFLKHLSDKRGAHIDIGHSPVVEMANAPITDVITPVLCIAIQTIWAVKHQVPELANYWPGMEIPEE